MKRYWFFLFMLITGILFIPFFKNFSDGENAYIILSIAWGMAFIHAGAGLMLNHRALNLSNKMFMRLVLGGVGIRMLAVAIAVVLLYPVIRNDLIPFILGFGFFYFLFHGMEIAFLLRWLKGRKNI